MSSSVFNGGGWRPVGYFSLAADSFILFTDRLLQINVQELNYEEDGRGVLSIKKPLITFKILFMRTSGQILERNSPTESQQRNKTTGDSTEPNFIISFHRRYLIFLLLDR